VRTNAREVSCYLSTEEAARFSRAAATTKVSLSRYLRQCLLDYERLVGGADQSISPATLALAETEQRIEQSIETQSKRITALNRQMQVLFAMLDRLAFVSLVHLPEVPQELRDGALASGTRLYNNWRHAVMELTETGIETGSQPAQPAQEANGQGHDHQESGDGFGSNSIDAAG
jgi:hypothetical protein